MPFVIRKIKAEIKANKIIYIKIVFQFRLRMDLKRQASSVYRAEASFPLIIRLKISSHCVRKHLRTHLMTEKLNYKSSSEISFYV